MTIITPLFKKAIAEIGVSGTWIIDIGGGLRISPERGDRFEKENIWIRDALQDSNYQILDPVPTYNPDIVGDIHSLPLEDGSVDSLVCLSVLEHVEDPKKAVQEMLRTLKPGGFLFLYVPFIFYYHAEPGYYKDYWRFSHDAIELLLKDFSSIEIEVSRGAIESAVNMFPLGSIPPIRFITRIFDRILGKHKSKQTAGYYVLAQK